MPPSRIYFHVKCDRCGTFSEARHEQGEPRQPIGWLERHAPAGASPDAVMLCRDCIDYVDRQMSRAWDVAIQPDPLPERP